ncbi:MAG: SDR family oxidoreductase [Candidatus Saliniplasma sp.]
MDLGIEGNTALILASSSGLGKASAKALAMEGVNIVINGRDREKLKETEQEINAVAAGEVLAQQGDITNYADIKNLVESTVKEFKGMDHLVTCAGGPPSKPFLQTSDEEWYYSFDLLVMSVVRVIRESVKYLRESDVGTIVNITSISVKEALESLVLSNSVRMAVIGLEKTLSRELGPDIRVNSVLPGPHETGRIKDLVEDAVERGDFEDYDEGLESWTHGVPLERIGHPEELGDVVAYLCSERSSYLDGVAIPIDGGGSRSNL